MSLFVLPVVFVAFLLSACVGMGGSLILIPALALIIGGKPAVILGALLLAGNNVAKVIVYAKTIPVRKSALLVLATVIGGYGGASLLVAAPEWAVDWAVLLSVSGTFCYEWHRKQSAGDMSGKWHWAPPMLALSAGATSGFSGTSGPLKGVALRAQGFNRIELVSAASAVSLFGDASKVLAFSQSGFYTGLNVQILLMALPLMPLAAWLGRRFNTQLGEQIYGVLFWSVMCSYGVRLFFV